MIIYQLTTAILGLLAFWLGYKLYKTQKALKNSRDRFFKAFNNAPLHFSLSRLDDGRFLDVNRMFTQNTGYTRDETFNKTALDLGIITPQDRKKMLDAVENGQGLEGFELDLHAKNGDIRHCRCYCATTSIEGQSCLMFMGLDLTKKRQIEHAQRQSENFYQIVINSISDPIFVKDRKHKFVLVNQAFCDLTGKSSADTHGRTDHDFFPPEQTEHFWAIDEEIFDKQSQNDGEEQVTDHQGKVHTIHTRKSFFTTADGRHFLVGVIRDLTEEKRAEAELRTFKRAVEQSPVSVVVTDLSGSIEYVNPKFSQITGYSAAEVKGKNPRILKSGTTPQTTYQNLWQTISSGHIWQGELLNKTKDGNTFWEHATISPLRDAAGQITHYIGIKEDVSEKKNLFEQLLQAQKIDSIGRMASGVAHDFNNMLAVISGNVELALHVQTKGKPVDKYLHQIKDATDRSAELTRQLLTFARKQVAKPVEIELNAMISKMLKMLKRLIGEDIELIWQPASNEIPLYIDPSYIDQILTNLVVNARDAMATTGVLTLATQLLPQPPCAESSQKPEKPAPYVRLSVTDTGCGMSSEVLDHIFEPFFTTKEAGKGTGLGLSTVYGIVQQNHGNIQIHSQPQQGTRIDIDLPQGAVVNHRDQPATASLRQTGTEKILLVEDEKSFLVTCQSMLEDLGYEVIATHDPILALKLAAEHGQTFDLLLTDVIMPHINGQELAKTLHIDQPNLRALFMSGYTHDVMLSRGLMDTGMSHLQKPFSSQVLAREVRKILDA